MKKSNIFDFIKKNGLILVIIIGLIIRLSFFFTLQPWGKGLATCTSVESDASQYNQLAEILLSDLSFERFGTYRTPGYPVFLALIYSITSSRIWVVLLIQIIVNIVSLILIYKIALLLFSEKIALLSAFFFGIDIYQAAYTNALLTDTLFVCFFIGSVYYLCKALKQNSLWSICLSPFFLALATLVRPISFLFPLVAVISIFVLSESKLYMRLSGSLIFVLVFIAVISPWLTRNYYKYDEVKLTSISGENLLMYNVAYTEQERTGETIENIRKKYSDLSIKNGADLSDSLSFKNSIIFTKIATQYIKENFVLYCKKNISGIVKMFINLDTGYLGSFFHSSTESVDLLDSKSISDHIGVFFHTKSLIEIIILFLMIPFLLIDYLFSFFGMVLLIRRHQKFVYLFILIILYFSAVVGVVGINRYKLPIMPFIGIMCAYGIIEIYSKHKEKQTKRQQYKIAELNPEQDPGIISSC